MNLKDRLYRYSNCWQPCFNITKRHQPLPNEPLLHKHRRPR